jgi:hypothetical protein
VHVALHNLRALGHAVRAKKPSHRAKKATPIPRREYDHLSYMRQQGLTWAVIGKLMQRDAKTLWGRYRRAEKLYGQTVFARAKRDKARDYIRMKELREDAGLPWRMVAKVVGMTPEAAGSYYSKLKKVYGV